MVPEPCVPVKRNRGHIACWSVIAGRTQKRLFRLDRQDGTTEPVLAS